MTSCTELLEALSVKTTCGRCAERCDECPTWRDAVARIAVNHLGPLVEALEYEHGAHWKEEPLPGHEDCVINSSCEEAECHVCKLLVALRTDLEAALEVE